jgi:hypothetical protein
VEARTKSHLIVFILLWGNIMGMRIRGLTSLIKRIKFPRRAIAETQTAVPQRIVYPPQPRQLNSWDANPVPSYNLPHGHQSISEDTLYYQHPNGQHYPFPPQHPYSQTPVQPVPPPAYQHSPELVQATPTAPIQVTEHIADTHLAIPQTITDATLLKNAGFNSPEEAETAGFSIVQLRRAHTEAVATPNITQVQTRTSVPTNPQIITDAILLKNAGFNSPEEAEAIGLSITQLRRLHTEALAPRNIPPQVPIRIREIHTVAKVPYEATFSGKLGITEATGKKLNEVRDILLGRIKGKNPADYQVFINSERNIDRHYPEGDPRRRLSNIMEITLLDKDLMPVEMIAVDRSKLPSSLHVNVGKNLTQAQDDVRRRVAHTVGDPAVTPEAAKNKLIKWFKEQPQQQPNPRLYSGQTREFPVLTKQPAPNYYHPGLNYQSRPHRVPQSHQNSYYKPIPQIQATYGIDTNLFNSIPSPNKQARQEGYDVRLLYGF